MRNTYWRMYATSVIGPGHIASGLPNQDAWPLGKRIATDALPLLTALGRDHIQISVPSLLVTLQ